MGNEKRIRRQRSVREDITGGSRWAPFLPSDRRAPMVTVCATPTPEASRVLVVSMVGRRYETRIETLLATYYLVRGELTPVLHAPRPQALPALAAAPPAPYATNGDGATIALGGKSLAVHVFKGRPCVIAADLGKLLEYADEGRGLASAMRKEWSAEFLVGRDYDVLSGDDLRAFKALVAQAGANPVSRNAKEVTVLYERGVDLVSTRTDKPAGVDLRAYLVDEVLPKLRRGEPVAPVAAPPPALQPAGMAEFRAEVRGMLKEVLASIPALVGETLRAIMPALPGPSAEPPPPAPSELIPKDWRSSDRIAENLTARFKDASGRKVSKREVDDIIKGAETVRGNAMLARTRRVVKGDSEATRVDVPQWMYAPAVAEMVYDTIRGEHGPRQPPLPGFAGGKGAS